MSLWHKILLISLSVEHTLIPLPRFEFSPGLTIQMFPGVTTFSFIAFVLLFLFCDLGSFRDDLLRRCLRARFCESFSVRVVCMGLVGDPTSSIFPDFCFGSFSSLVISLTSYFDGRLIAGKRVYCWVTIESPSWLGWKLDRPRLVLNELGIYSKCLSSIVSFLFRGLSDETDWTFDIYKSAFDASEISSTAMPQLSQFFCAGT